ncbi:MAG: YeeE/YedE family protein, partial [Deltaproteobacteria bacterium]|nr:YeeE/YedE family protein [Deltaproteobacteria bacterium]
MSTAADRSEKFWNPYLAGVALGLVLLGSFLVAGHGLGSSGAAHRVGVAVLDAVAPAHVAANPFLAQTREAGHPLDDWLVFEIFGVFLGGLVAAYSAGRLKLGVLTGPRFSKGKRIAFAIAGGMLMGFAARMARGCTSGQALSGGALLSAGAWA